LYGSPVGARGNLRGCRSAAWAQIKLMTFLVHLCAVSSARLIVVELDFIFTGIDVACGAGVWGLERAYDIPNLS
jgi:hypothetical protein